MLSEKNLKVTRGEEKAIAGVMLLSKILKLKDRPGASQWKVRILSSWRLETER